jgi:alpha-L-fucosidase
MPTGEVVPKEIEVLKVVGDWMGKYGESVYQTRGGPLRNASWGGTTYRGDTVFVHVLKWPGETLRLRPLDEKILSARALTGGEVRFAQSTNGIALTLPAADRHPLNTVIALKLDRPVSKIYEGLGTASLFDGPGYGELLSRDATFETSSSSSEKPVAASDRTLFTGAQPAVAFETQPETNPWVLIDLGASQNVKGLRITNRPGSPKSDGMELLVSTDKITWTSVWKAAAPEAVWEVPVTQYTAGAHIPGVPARYLKLQLNSPRKTPLALKQVEVFGDSPQP